MTLFSQAITKQILKPLHIILGLELKEVDDHIIALMHEDEVIARFSAIGAHKDEVIKAADEWVEKNKQK